MFYRAPIEEMLQRAGVNSRGPPVPEGPPVNVGGSSAGAGGKNYNFTTLP